MDHRLHHIPQNDVKNISAWAQIVMVLLMLINHPVYEKKEIEPDAALQRSRIKKGKETLSKYIYIKMRPDIKDRLKNSDGSIRAPHWRRGHIRRLGDGRVVPVQACLVNWDGDPADIEKKVYVL